MRNKTIIITIAKIEPFPILKLNVKTKYIMLNKSEKKGIEVEYFFFIFGLIFAILILGLWQQMGMGLATQRMSELKINTIAQIKNTLFLMQSAPVKTYTCASLRNCNRVTIHPTYIEIWGPENKRFNEGVYLSDSLVGNMDLYEYTKTSWEVLSVDGYTTPCEVFLCFEKVDENSIYIIGPTTGK